MFVKTPQFVFTASADDVAKITHPLLLYAGTDFNHPAEVAREIAKLKGQIRSSAIANEEPGAGAAEAMGAMGMLARHSFAMEQ